jgi:hypothetical protein
MSAQPILRTLLVGLAVTMLGACSGDDPGVDSRADAVVDGATPTEAAAEIDVTGTPSDAGVDDAGIDAPAVGDTAAIPDPATLGTCPCAPLTALLAACPQAICVGERPKPTGLGRGFTETARVFKPDGSLCYELHFFFDAPSDAFRVVDAAGRVVALSSLGPGHQHDLSCGDDTAAQPMVRNFVVTDTQCPLLGKTACTDAGVPHVPAP